MSQIEQGKLSRDEVEALLEATREEPVAAARPEPVRRVEAYNFHQPSRFNKSQLDKLRRINEGVAQSAARQAAKLLRSSVQVQLVSMEHITWESLLQEVGESVAAFTFAMMPFGYQGVVTVDGPFAAACLERMLGGQPDAAESLDLNFTDMDARVFASFVRAFLDPLPELWARIGEFSVDLGGFVQDLQSLDVFTGSEGFFQLCFLVQTSAGSGQVAISAPFQTVRSLPPDADEEEAPVVTGDTQAAGALRESLRSMPVELAVVLGKADLKVARLVHAAVGDVIVLDTRVGDALEVHVNNKAKFRGYPGVSNGKRAVKLVMEGQ